VFAVSTDLHTGLSLGLLSGIKGGTKRLSDRSIRRLSDAVARLRAEGTQK